MEKVMRKFLFSAAAISLLAIAPAAAEIMGDDPGGRDDGTQVGQMNPIVERTISENGHECRLVRERTKTAEGHIVIKTHRVCD
jgi:hypothetical protein